jgi:hypothetical protein
MSSIKSRKWTTFYNEDTGMTITIEGDPLYDIVSKEGWDAIPTNTYIIVRDGQLIPCDKDKNIIEK